MSTRAYQMGARAQAVAETRQAVMQATIERYVRSGIEGLTLDDIAGHAGVTVQTILRHFGSKEGLVTSTVEFARADILRARHVEPVGDARSAIKKLLATYEAFGDLNWQLLRDEARDATIHAVLTEARATHRSWIEQVFAPHLACRGSWRQQRVEVLFAATDFYIWKLYRRDLAQSAARTEQRIWNAVEALCASFAASDAS